MSCIVKIRLTVSMETVCRGSEGVGQESSLIGRRELHAYLSDFILPANMDMCVPSLNMHTQTQTHTHRGLVCSSFSLHSYLYMNLTQVKQPCHESLIYKAGSRCRDIFFFISRINLNK